jgi:hypothetical protein
MFKRQALIFVFALFMIQVVCAQTQKKCLVIGIDGLRPDALAVANAPNLHALIQGAAYSADTQCEDLTFSGPNWSAILHGIHRDKSRVTTNDYSGNVLANYPDFLARLEAHRPQWNTARLSTWDALHYNQPTGADINIFRNYTQDGDARITQDAMQLMFGSHPNHPGVDIDVMFIYYADVDVAGHTYGFHPSRTGYIREIENTDLLIGWVLAAMRNRPNFAHEEWLIVITSDHGGAIDGSHHGNTPEKRTTLFIVKGPGVIPGTPFPQPKTVDVSKTVLTYMGVPINPAWGLDGHTVGFTPGLPRKVQFHRNLVFNGDAEYDRGFNEIPFDQYISGWNDPGPDQMTSVQYNAPDGWPTSNDPGPPNRGNACFTGGQSPLSNMTQTLDLSPVRNSLLTGNVRFEFEAWIGGYGTQEDYAEVRLEFLSSGGQLLSSALLPRATAAQRQNRTALLRRSAAGSVPASTAQVRFSVNVVRMAGSWADGYTDNIQFRLLYGADVNRDGCVNDADLLLVLFAFGNTGSDLPADVNRDGVVDDTDLLSVLFGFGEGCS